MLKNYVFLSDFISLVLCLILSSFILSGCSSSNEPFEEKKYTSDTQINEIKIDVRDREIEVSLSEDEQVHIKYYENSKEYYDISVSDENVLTMASVTGSINISSNGGNITFGDLDVGSALTLNVKNGDISGAIVGSYDDFSIQSKIKKGESNLPDNKDNGEKTLNVTGNKGNVDIEFVNE